MGKETQEYNFRFELAGENLVFKGMDKITAKGKVAKQEVSALNKTIGNLGAILATLGVARGVNAMVKLASDAEETRSKFNVVFGELNEEARNWAVGFGKEVGRSRQDIERWMATLQDTFVPLGFSRQRALDFSSSLTKLAVDVASFNNAADDEVLRDFTSALVGNHETVRKYGIIISESSLAQEAMNSGLNKSYSKLTDLEKVQLRYNLLLKGTGDAQGDAVRTGDSYANQLKRLDANMTNLGERLGNELLPAFNDIITATNRWVEANGDLIDTFADFLRYATTGGLANLSEAEVGHLRYINELEEKLKTLEESYQHMEQKKGGFLVNDEALEKSQLELLTRIAKVYDELTHARAAYQTAYGAGAKSEDEDKKTPPPPPPPPGPGLPGQFMGQPGYYTGDQARGNAPLERDSATLARQQREKDLKGMIVPIGKAPDMPEEESFERIYNAAEGVAGKIIPLFADVTSQIPSQFEQMAETVESLMGSMADSTQAFFDVLVGGGDAGKAFANMMLAGVSQAAAAKGRYYFLEGLAQIWFNPAAGAGLMAAGSGLMLFSSALGSAGGGRSSYGGSGMPAAPYGGSYAPSSRESDSNRAGGSIQIVLYNAGANGRALKLDSSQAGRFIDSAVEDKKFANYLKEQIRTGKGMNFNN